MKHKRKIELLAPAGNFEKLEIAIYYGADAVYLAGKAFSLRNFTDNFSLDELKEAVAFAHKKNVNVYVACNTYPRNDEMPPASDYLNLLGKIEPDAVIGRGAEIAPHAHIGSGAAIGSKAKIGVRTVIGAHARVAGGSLIGDDEQIADGETVATDRRGLRLAA